MRDRGIYEIICNGNAAAYLLESHREAPAPLTPAVGDGGTMLLNQVINYATATMKRETTASLALILVNFQKFLVLSTCEVLRATGAPREHIFRIVKICVGDVSDEYCGRILRTAVYLNELIDVLNTNGWGDHAGELLLICKSLIVQMMKLKGLQGINLQLSIKPLHALPQTAWNTLRNHCPVHNFHKVWVRKVNGHPFLSLVSFITF